MLFFIADCATFFVHISPPSSLSLSTEENEDGDTIFAFMPDDTSYPKFDVLNVDQSTGVQEWVQLKTTMNSDVIYDWIDKYQYIIDLGRRLPLLSDAEKVEANKIKAFIFPPFQLPIVNKKKVSKIKYLKNKIKIYYD